ncbi:MAG: hypothetical protein HKL90_11615, partial [Elusimicrobia bacterium]|nr:hypothetical protein [Elusimicrobiota bacterium]
DAALVEFLAPSQRAKLLMWRSMGAFRTTAAGGPGADDLQETDGDEEQE